MPELRFVNQYHDDPGYIDALAARVQDALAARTAAADKLVMSFHGVPRALAARSATRTTANASKTARLLAERLGLRDDRVVVTFQSRFGRARWLEPYTEPTLRELARAGRRAGST